MSRMNLPNRLTLLRLGMVPLCISATLLPPSVLPPVPGRIIAIVLFIAAAVTDAFDGHIARKYGLVTDFGKFMDPLADKFMVIGEMMAIVYCMETIRPWFFWVTFAVIFRELAVTSLRLILVSQDTHTVVAAGMLGKCKTVCQMVCVTVALAEPLWLPQIPDLPEVFASYPPLTFVFSVLTFVFTVWSGIDYFVHYAKFLKAA